MMNKILLTKFIREEIKNVREQMSDDLENTTSNDDAYSKAFDSMDTDPTQAIEKMADALDVNVSVHLSARYNRLTFNQREDVDEKKFEQMIQFLERIGYNVDLGQSVRTYDFEPGERNFYPRIIF
jgi:uncharacterized protein YdhG (YjbR/CyaY superfamily)